METLRPRRLPTSERLRPGRPGNGQLFCWVWPSGAGGADEERRFNEGALPRSVIRRDSSERKDARKHIDHSRTSYPFKLVHGLDQLLWLDYVQTLQKQLTALLASLAFI